MADGFDFFFSPTGPSWMPDRSPKGARRGRDGETDPRASAPVFRNARPWRGPESELSAEPGHGSVSEAPGTERIEPARESEPAWVSEPLPEADLHLEHLEPPPERAEPAAPAAPHPTRPAPLSIGQATAVLRDVAAPTLRAAVSQLLAHGHEVSLRDALDSVDPRLVVLLLPSEGPLRRVGAPDPSLAGFEIRIEDDRGSLLDDGRDRLTEPDAGPPAGPRVVARHSSGPASGGFLTLGRTPAAGLDSAWITDRFVEFVQLALERALDTT